MFASLAAFAVLCAWLVLYLGRGDFWRADQLLGNADVAIEEWPAVVAIVPARNEAAGIGPCVRSILSQDYPNSLRLVVVDDQSQDDTGEIARSAAEELGASNRLQVIAGKDLPPGWAGKVWAVAQGVGEAGLPSYFWFTDGDIVHKPDVLRRLVSKALLEEKVLVSLMVRLSCHSFWERWLIPPFIFFFQKLYPFPWVNNQYRNTAGAAGGCMLVSRPALEASGGLVQMRGALIDDCTLAAQLKTHGAIWLGLADGSESLRVYSRLSEIWRMVARSAYVQLDWRLDRLLSAAAGMLFLYVAPWILVILGGLSAKTTVWVPGLASLVASWRLYWPTLRYCKISPIWLVSLQPAALLYILMTLDSARRYYLGRGAGWKGRTYS